MLHWTPIQHHSHQESLNFYIDDDKQEENNYETYLKFKKKTLQRDLDEAEYENNVDRDRKQRGDEERLFR